MKNFIIVISVLFITGITHAQRFPSGGTGKKLIYKIIPATGKTWGYDIYSNGKLMVHQPSIPAMSGNAGFASKGAAIKVAKKVIDKIVNGHSPPTISIAEMKQLGAIPKQ